MIIGVAGFCWSGSGAVLDYLMEFDENQVYPEEFGIAYHPDGLIDLDYNLNENCAKFLSSGVAIPRFKIVSNMLLGNIIGKDAKKITDEFINNITQVKWVGCEEGQVLLHNPWIYKKIGLRLRGRIIQNLPMEFCQKHRIYPLNDIYFSIEPDDFIYYVNIYISEIFKAMGFDLNKNIVLNQPFPGNTPLKSMKYYNDARAIVVDRDPRDVYVFLKAVFPGHSYSVPLDNVEKFVTYYSQMHKNLARELSDENILYLKFEDLIYEYEKTTNTINEFCGIKKHKFQYKYFDPKMSISNTQVFKEYPELSHDIDFIERKLKSFLYDFDKYPNVKKTGKTFDDNPLSSAYSFRR